MLTAWYTQTLTFSFFADLRTYWYLLCQDNVSTLLPVFEQCLSDAPATASYDALRQSVVILMGTLAKHLDADNPKVRPIVGLLIETLSTPSQQVNLHLRRSM